MERLFDLGLAVGDSAMDVGLDWMGERDLPPADGRMFSNRGLLDVDEGLKKNPQYEYHHLIG